MSMDVIRNHMRLEAERATSKLTFTCAAIVTSYDPDHYACKVRLQPEDDENPDRTLTGWLPIASEWVGPSWGSFFPPSVGEQVEVHFQSGDQESAYVSKRFFSASVPPLAVSSGEGWLVHQSGSCLKFHNDGSVQVVAIHHLNITGDVYVEGAIFATGDITDQTLTTAESMQGMRNVFNTHHHLDVTQGSDLSGLPDEFM